MGVERMWERESVRSSKFRLISQFNDKKTLIGSSQPPLRVVSPIEMDGHNTSAPTYVPPPKNAEIDTHFRVLAPHWRLLVSSGLWP
jgi:hypothetical protein